MDVYIYGTESALDVHRKIAEEISVLPPFKYDRFLCAFSHIFAGGYAAGYYSYLWADVLSADAFAAFEEAGIGRPRIGGSSRQTVSRYIPGPWRVPSPHGGI